MSDKINLNVVKTYALEELLSNVSEQLDTIRGIVKNPDSGNWSQIIESASNLKHAIQNELDRRGTTSTFWFNSDSAGYKPVGESREFATELEAHLALVDALEQNHSGNWEPGSSVASGEFNGNAEAFKKWLRTAKPQDYPFQYHFKRTYGFAAGSVRTTYNNID